MTVALRTGIAAALTTAALAGIALTAVRADVAPHVVADDPVAAGRFLINYGGCNDCHTAGMLEGRPLPAEPARLEGSRLGFLGPWGVTYAPNLRLVFASLTPQQWSAMIANPGPLGKPPMPWASVQQLGPADQRAIYAYIRSLGPAGTPAPPDVPPGQAPATAYLIFAPTTPPPH